jgi:hypothetical protein
MTMVSTWQLLGFGLASLVLIVVGGAGGLAMIGVGVTVAITGRHS